MNTNEGAVPDEVRKKLADLPSNPYDLLTDEEKQRLAEDLKAIHDTLHPCWADQPTRKARKSQLTTRELASLNLACAPLKEAFGHPPYLVGSVEQGDRGYRDVDVRLILPDDEFDATFGREFFWHIFCWAVAEWLTKQTGLPIDFQVQRMTEANEKYGDLAKHPRNPLGSRGRLFAGGGDATKPEAEKVTEPNE